MVKKSCGVNNFKTKLIITVFGILMVMLGFTLTDLIIKVGFQEITRQVIAIVTLVAIILEYVTLGIRPNNVIKTVKRFTNQQKITFVIASIVGVYAILGLFGWEGISSFTSGQLIVVGFLTILDVWTV